MTAWRLHVLGSSSTLTPPGEASASLALSNGNRIILVDAGGDLPARLREARLSRDDVTDVIITHSHPDHTYGLPFLSHSYYHDHRELTCWSTAEALPRLKDSLEAYDLQDPDKYITFDFREISTTVSENLELVESLTMESLPNDHSRPGFGLAIESNQQRIVFSGDTTPCDRINRAARGADVLLHDCQGLHGYRRYFKESHTSANELGKLAEEADVSTLVPFHHNLTEIPGSWEEILGEIRKSFDGTILYPHKGMGFAL